MGYQRESPRILVAAGNAALKQDAEGALREDINTAPAIFEMDCKYISKQR